MDGLLLFAHGARDPAWARPFDAIALRLRTSRPEVPVALSYLEFMSPGIEEAAAQLVAAGCTRVHVMPLFLGTGGHVRRDIPPLLERLQEQHGAKVQWLLQAPLGDQDSVLDAISATCLSALDTPAATPAP